MNTAPVTGTASSARCAACGLSEDAHPHGWAWRLRRDGEAPHPVEMSYTTGDGQAGDLANGNTTVFVPDHRYTPQEPGGGNGGKP